MNQDIIELENFIPKDYADHLERLMSSFDFPWYFNPNMVSGDDDFKGLDSNISGFNHFFFENNNKVSPFFDLVYPLILSITSRADLPFNRLIRMRANLNLPNRSSPLLHHMPHIDSFFPHWNAIYYVNDNDGDTFIFNETNDDYDSGQDDILRIKKDQFTIKQRVQARKGKILIFPGKYYHTSSWARDAKYRCVININLGNVLLT